MLQIGVSDYSFRHDFGTTLDYVNEFPKKAASLGIKGLELIDGHLEKFLPDIELADVKKFKDGARQQGVDVLSITGFNTGLSWGFGQVWDPFSLNSVQHYINLAQGIVMDWLETCTTLKIPNIRFDAGGFQASHKVPIYKAIDLNIEIYKRILVPVCEQAHEAGVKVGVENHGYFTSDIKVLKKMLAEIPHLHVTCDTGNWPFESRLDDIKAIAGRVNFMHAKTHVFNADGTEKNIDYASIVDIMKAAGFDGWWSIEWEGPATLSDEEGVRKSVELLKRYT